MIAGQGVLILFYRSTTKALREDATGEECLARKQPSPGLWASLMTFCPQSYYNHLYTTINKSEKRTKYNLLNTEGKLCLITSEAFYTIKNISRFTIFC